MNNKRLLTGLLLCAVPLSQLAIDIYTPSFPAMMESLRASAAQVQWTITLYMFGMAVSQVFMGPLSDQMGRRPVLLGGAAVLALASVIGVMQPSIYWLLAWRFIAGLGAGACTVTISAMLAEGFTNQERAKITSFTSIAYSVPPVVAPFIGGHLQELWNWHANFIFIFVFDAFVLILLLIGLPETREKALRQPVSVRQTLRSYGQIIKNRRFVGLTLILVWSWSVSLAFITLGPFLLQGKYGLSPVEYGTMALLIGFAYTLGALLNSALVRYFYSEAVCYGAILVTVLLSLLMVVVSFAGIQHLYVVVGFSFAVVAGTGLMFPNALAAALGVFSEQGGTAGALLTVIIFFGGMLATMLVALVQQQSSLILAMLYFLFAGLAVLSWWWAQSAKHAVAS